jgi:hypothetical protein
MKSTDGMLQVTVKCDEPVSDIQVNVKLVTASSQPIPVLQRCRLSDDLNGVYVDGKLMSTDAFLVAQLEHPEFPRILTELTEISNENSHALDRRATSYLMEWRARFYRCGDE